jgi:hypothetical protein
MEEKTLTIVHFLLSKTMDLLLAMLSRFLLFSHQSSLPAHIHIPRQTSLFFSLLTDVDDRILKQVLVASSSS